MLRKLDDLLKRYEFLSEQLADPAVIADMGTWQKYSKEQSDLSETAEKYVEYKQTEREMNDAFAAAEEETDTEMKKMLIDEGYACKERLQAVVGGQRFHAVKGAIDNTVAVKDEYFLHRGCPP